jgi:hypothetical protein
MMSEKQPLPAEEMRQEEVRPGLEMQVRRTRKEDGRYLIYFDFERRAQGGAPGERHE